LILGPLAGIAVGYIGAKLMLLANKKGWTSDVFEGIAALTLAGSAYLVATEIGGNGFIAAFVAGLTLGNIIKGRCKFLFEFTESEGQLLMWTAFLLLGVALLPEAIGNLTSGIFALIMISLFIVRPLAIWLSLTGTDAAPATRLFFGWFGPRGLATALFALLILPQIGGDYAETILTIAINAVWISAVLHGVSAAPLGNIYANMVAHKGDCAEKRPTAKPFSDTRTTPKPQQSGEKNA
jgi:NhaP-type Na+/H+ or K+/H+ antiporter